MPLHEQFSQSDKDLLKRMAMSADAAEIAVLVVRDQANFEEAIAQVMSQRDYNFATFRTICERELDKRRRGRT